MTELEINELIILLRKYLSLSDRGVDDETVYEILDDLEEILSKRNWIDPKKNLGE